jgi:hypothetical protein
MLAAVVLSLFMCPAFSGGGAAPGHGQEPVTTFEWLAVLMDSVTSDLDQQGHLTGEDPVLIRVHANDSLFAAVQRSLLRERLLAAGTKVIGRAGAGPYRTLSLRWVEWSVDYRPLGGQSPQYERNLRAVFFVEMVDRGSQVVHARRLENALRDILSQSQRDAASSPSLPFTMASRLVATDAHPLWRKTFLFAITATVVYLFYSIRSQ